MRLKIRTRLTAALVVGSALLLSAPPSGAAIITYDATLSGSAEAPPNTSPGTGTATVTFDDGTKLMTIEVSFSGLTSNTTAAHLHCCTTVPGSGNAAVATMAPPFTGFPIGVTAGTMNQTFDMMLQGSYAAAFYVANGNAPNLALAALLAGMDTGKAYFNIHTSTFGGGEIRGFLRQVPEPGSLALFGLAAVAFARRRDRR